jgi:hypothetical protein
MTLPVELLIPPGPPDAERTSSCGFLGGGPIARTGVSVQAQVPIDGTGRLVGVLESQSGLERVRIEPVA